MPITVTPKQLSTLLAAAIPAREPILVVGSPGIGKSAIVEEAAQAAQADLILSHPVTADPTDAKGLPWKVDGRDAATFLPYGELEQAVNATRPTVWFLDDLGQASPAVQASFMQLLLARRVNGHKLPDCVTFVAATNRRIDRAGVSGVLEPVKSRFVTIVELVANLNDWCMWAYNEGIDPLQIAFLRMREEFLSKFEPSADLTNSPSPRTWRNLDKLAKLSLPPAIEQAAFSGAVGEAAATEYMAFRTLAKNLVNIDAILLNPDKVALPTNPSVLYATVVGLAARANSKNFSRIGTYAERLLSEAKRGEVAVLLIRDATRRDETLTHTQTFVKINSGPLGQLISGQSIDD